MSQTTNTPGTDPYEDPEVRRRIAAGVLAVPVTAPARPAWEIAHILLPAAAIRFAKTREDITAGIATHVYGGKPGSFLDTPEWARLTRQEIRREAVHRRLVAAMRDAIVRAER